MRTLFVLLAAAALLLAGCGAKQPEPSASAPTADSGVAPAPTSGAMPGEPSAAPATPTGEPDAEDEPAPGSEAPADTAAEPDAEGFTTTDSGLRYKDLTVGEGDAIADGQKASVHYVGTLEDGSKFDSSRDRNEPFDFTVGAGEVIKAWDEGVAGMKVGGKRQLICPPEIAYGAASPSPKIPANSTLYFEVELLAIQ